MKYKKRDRIAWRWLEVANKESLMRKAFRLEF